MTLAEVQSLVFRTTAAPAAAMEALDRSSTLEIISDERGFRELAPVWDTLLEQSASRSPFLRWDWVSLWWEQEHDRFDLAITVLRDAHGEVRAIAPLVLGRPLRGPRRSLRHLSFMGGIGQIESLRLDFIVPRGEESRLTPRLCEVFTKLRAHWDMVRLIAVPAESPNLPFIVRALKSCASGARVVNTHDCHFISLPHDWHEYEMSRSINWRGQIRRKWKAMETKHRGRTCLAGEDMPVKIAMDELAVLHARRWSEDVSEYLRPAAQIFHHQLAARWVPQGRALLPYIEIGGRMAAAVYALVEDDTVYHFQMGWDPAFEEISVGKLAMAWCIRDSMTRHARVYDMLPGEFEYKKRWCDETRHVLDLEAFHPHRLQVLVFRALRAAKRAFSGHGHVTLSNNNHHSHE